MAERNATQRSSTIYVIKALAIFSAICAHCNTVSDQSNVFIRCCSLLLQNIGNFGVPCFFVISGLLFHYREGQVAAFFKRRLTRLVAPWIISATCVYLYVYLRRPPLTVTGWANFVLGNGSYLYYLSVLFLLYCIFYFLPFMRTNTALFISQAVTIASLFFFPEIGKLSPYLNPLNWIGYFALGMQINMHKQKLAGIFHRIFRFRGAVYLLCILLLGIQLWRGSGGIYWGGFNVIVCWSGAATLTLLGVALVNTKCRRLQRILEYAGKESLFIYLWHMPIAGIVANLGSRSFLSLFCIVRPIVVLGVVLGAATLAAFILKKMNLPKLRQVIGLSAH